MTRVLANELELEVDLAGAADKPALLLLHALGTDLSMWDAVVPHFLQNFRVIRFDARGHGETTGETGPFSIATLGRDAIALLDQLGIQTAHLIGVSLGGAVAQWIAVNRPDRVNRLILANTAARFGTPASWNDRIRRLNAGLLDENAAATIARWFSPAFIERNAGLVDRFSEQLRRMDVRSFTATCAALRDFDLRIALRRLAAPALIITGADDPSVSERDTQIMLAALPSAYHHLLPTRHMSAVEAPAAFANVALGFLLRTADPASAGEKKSPCARNRVGRPARTASPKLPKTKGRHSASSGIRPEQRREISTGRERAAPVATGSTATGKPHAETETRGSRKKMVLARAQTRSAVKTTTRPSRSSGAKETGIPDLPRAKPKQKRKQVEADHKMAGTSPAPARRPAPLKKARLSKPADELHAEKPKASKPSRTPKNSPKPASAKTAAVSDRVAPSLKPPSPRRKKPTKPRRPKGRG